MLLAKTSESGPQAGSAVLWGCGPDVGHGWGGTVFFHWQREACCQQVPPPWDGRPDHSRLPFLRENDAAERGQPP